MLNFFTRSTATDCTRAILTMVQDIERADAIKAQMAATYDPGRRRRG
jgi:hypothetical protein